MAIEHLKGTRKFTKAEQRIVWARLNKYKKAGMDNEEIATALNEEEIKTANGKEWNKNDISNQVFRMNNKKKRKYKKRRVAGSIGTGRSRIARSGDAGPIITDLFLATSPPRQPGTVFPASLLNVLEASDVSDREKVELLKAYRRVQKN